jgi:hypothetical protein
MLADSAASEKLAAAGLTRADLEAAVEPTAYLGTSAVLVRRALTAHRDGTAERSTYE